MALPKPLFARNLLLLRASRKAPVIHLSVPANYPASRGSSHSTGSAKMRAEGYTQYSRHPLSSTADRPLFVPLVFTSWAISLGFLLIFATSSPDRSAIAINADMRHEPWVDGGEGAGAALAWMQVPGSSGYSSCLGQQSWGARDKKHGSAAECSSEKKKHLSRNVTPADHPGTGFFFSL